MKIVVTTPTGNVGSKVVLALLRAGHRPTVLLRDSSKLSAEVLAKVDVVEGSLTDSSALDRAFTGADSVFFVSPPDYTAADPTAHYRVIAEAVIASLNRTGVNRIVHLSGSWVSDQTGRGMLDGIALTESILDGLDANIHHLRPGFFYENFFFQADSIRAGQYYSSISPEVALPFIAAKDIAEVAALWLLNPNWTGKTYQELSGPRVMTGPEALAEVSRGIGHKVDYVQVPEEAVVESFLSTGASRGTSEAYGLMLRAVSSGDSAPEREIGERTGTHLATWAFENLRG